jgi:hypothetical protein
MLATSLRGVFGRRIPPSRGGEDESLRERGSGYAWSGDPKEVGGAELAE